MKKILLLIGFCCVFANCFAKAAEWTWMKGCNTGNCSGVLGTIGIPDSLNSPPALWRHCNHQTFYL